MPSTSPPSATSFTSDHVGGLRRSLYVALALMLLTLGLVGVVVPGLPTTPFVLLASYLLARSWPRLNERLMRSRLLGPLLRDWQQHRAVSLRVKIAAVLMVLLALAVVVGVANLPAPLLACVVLGVAVGLTVIYRIPTRRQSATNHDYFAASVNTRCNVGRSCCSSASNAS